MVWLHLTMHVTWFGQSAFALTGGGRTVVIDPFPAAPFPPGSPVRWDYPPMDGVAADLLLVSHEHGDHNGVEAVAGEPHLNRSTPGTFSTPAGTVVGVLSEHDPVAGTR